MTLQRTLRNLTTVGPRRDSLMLSVGILPVCYSTFCKLHSHLGHCTIACHPPREQTMEGSRRARSLEEKRGSEGARTAAAHNESPRAAHRQWCDVSSGRCPSLVQTMRTKRITCSSEAGTTVTSVLLAPMAAACGLAPVTSEWEGPGH